jgi:hypothetical protein
MTQIIHVVGARPNFMKAAPVYEALKQTGKFDQRLGRLMTVGAVSFPMVARFSAFQHSV